MTPFISYYKILGVDSSADLATLRKAFHALSKELHPDTTSLPREEASEKFQLICEAYENLSDPILRQSYDETFFNQADKYINKINKVNGAKVFATNTTIRPENLRPLSGGELFSLLLLVSSLLISFVLCVGVAWFQGR